MRYVARARKVLADWFDEDTPLVANIEVDCACEVDTGLMDVSGNPIYRVPSPIGFGRDDE